MLIAIELNIDEFEEFLEFRKNREKFIKFQRYDSNKNKDTKISSCEFELKYNRRIQNALKSADIQTIQQLSKLSENNILKIKNFGRKSLNEIKRYCKENSIPFY